MILKREKATVKRTISDPCQSQRNSPSLVEFQSNESFTLANVTFKTEEAEFISSTLQDDVFTQVQDNMLLQGRLAIEDIIETTEDMCIVLQSRCAVLTITFNLSM